MKTIFIDKATNQGTVYTCKSDLIKKIGVSRSTLLNWSKGGIKQTEQFIICFDVSEVKNRKLIRSHSF